MDGFWGSGQRDLLAQKQAKGQWYEALEILKVQDLPQLDAEDSVRFWGTVLLGHPGPLGRLFVGEMHAIFDNTSDPNVLFLGRDDVGEIADAFKHLDKNYLVELFRMRNPGWINHAWLYEPLRAFLFSARSNGKAVIILWEN